MKRRARDSIPHSETNLFYSVPILVSNVGLIWIKLFYIKTMGFLKDICNARNHVQARHKSVRLPKTTYKFSVAKKVTGCILYENEKRWRWPVVADANIDCTSSLFLLYIYIYIYIYFLKMFLLIWCITYNMQQFYTLFIGQ